MGISRLTATLKAIAVRAATNTALLKVVFGLSAVLLVFAPPTARPGGAAEVYDFQICSGYFALCAASTCTDHRQGRDWRHCDVPRGGLHVSDPFRPVACQRGRGQHAGFLRGAGTG